MTTNNSEAVANLVLERAKKRGFVLQRDIREIFDESALPADCWGEFITLIHAALQFRDGCFYCDAPRSRLQQQRDQLQEVRDTLHELLAIYRAEVDGHERRGENRITFLRPMKVETEDHQEFNVLSQDISPSGIRLVSSRSFLGRKIRLHCPINDDFPAPIILTTRILWSSAVADGLYKNGGLFLELISK